MKTVRIAGVPEHFNLPWHMAMEEGAFADRGIDLLWTEVPEGTGRMCRMLQEGETDLAVILTEGVLKSIAEGNPARIVQEYIASPLLWGIHVAASSAYEKPEDLRGKTAAISRYGSGSHLMAYLHAEAMGWETGSLKFEVVQNTEGAVKALTEGAADYFLWEHFTTKPLTDGGIFRRLGDFPTPWPCFVIAAGESFLENNASLLKHILEVINLYTEEFRQIPSIDRHLANRYGQQQADIREWLSRTFWSQEQIESQVIENVIDKLFHLKLINNNIPVSEILYSGS